MKKKKILVLFPILGLLLSGCTFQEGLATTKSWISQHIYHPIKDWITGGGNKEEQKDDGGDDQHEDTKVYKEIVSVKAPESIKKGETLAPSSVDLVVKYAIGTQEGTENVKAESVELDTSKAGDAVQGKAKFKTLEKAFTIKVTEEGGGGGGDEDKPVHAGTEADPYSSADAVLVASKLESGGVTEDFYYVKGEVESFEEEFKPSYGNYSFKLKDGFIGWRLKNGPTYQLFKEGDLEVGDTVTMYVKIQSFGSEGKPESKDGYITKIEKPAPVDAELVSVKISGEPQTSYLSGAAYNHEHLVATATYDNGDTQDVSNSATWKIDKTTAAVGDESITITVEFNGKSDSLVVQVTVKDSTAPTHAGTAEDPYDGLDAVIVAKKLQESDKDNRYPTEESFYIKDVVTEILENDVAQYGNFTFMLNGGFEGYRLKNGPDKEAFTNERDIEVGDTVTIYAQILNFKGTYENHEGYVYSIEKSEANEIVSLIEGSAKGIPESVVQYKSLDKSKITVGVNYKSGNTGEVNPDKIELDTTVPGKEVAGNLVVGAFKYSFTIEVTAAPVPTGDSIVFTLGDDGEASHADGTAATDNAYSETVGGVTLSLVNGVKMYTGARDAHGNGCIKMGTGSAGGSFDIDVAGIEGLEKVIIRVAQYKSRNDGTIAIDGGEAYTMAKTSDAGEYDEVEVAITTQTKISVAFAARGMINEIEFVKTSTPATPVESVTIQQDDMTIDVSVGATVLTTVVAPEEVKDSTVSWTSSVPSVATVEDGTVTPLLSGTTVITAFVDENGNGVFDSETEKSDTINITVTTILQSITIVNASPMNLVVGDSESIQVTYNPENADNKLLHYSSSDSEVATVDKDGLVTAVGAGDAVITINPDTSAEAKTLDVHVSDVVVPITGVSITGAPEGAIIIGQEVDLVGSVTPDNATQNPKTLSWSVVDESSEGVVTVDNGHVVAQKVGTATVRAASDFNSEFYADVEFTVEKVAVSSVTVTPGSLELTVGGQGTQLSAAVEPSNASFPEITWSSDNEEVATVSDSGVVSPVGAGETTIKATADGVVGSCTVSVEAVSAIVQPGTYVISAVAESTTYYMKENGSSSAPTPVTSMDEATQFDFVLVENTSNQYYIKVGDLFLNSTDANNGIRVSSTACVWTISAGSIENSEGFDISTVTGSKTRYISLYNTQDWRGYDSPTATNRKSNTDVLVPVTSTLESIAVTTQPTKLAYKVGETFDPAGLVVTAHYELSDSTTKDVVLTSEQYELSFSGAFTDGDVGEKEITVSFGGKSASFNVTVEEQTATLVSVSIEGTPQTAYTVGENYSYAGLTAIAHYSDSSTSDVTAAAEWSVSKAQAEAGDSSITIYASYGGETGNLPVNVTVTAAADPIPYDFTNISDFSTWGNSYAAHVVEYDECTVSFEAASKQGTTISNMPVIKGGKYVNVVAKESRQISAVTFSFTQWGTKTQTMTLYYSTDGGNTWTSTGISVSDFSDLTSASLPNGTNAVQIKGSNTSNQIGIAGVVVTYK